MRIKWDLSQRGINRLLLWTASQGLLLQRVHIVSAYCTELRLVLGIEAVDKKSNEITAIPKILDKLVEGSLVTIDAIGCQTDICQKILDKKADYLLCAKENQPTLCHNIEFLRNTLDPTDPEPEDNKQKNRNPRTPALLGLDTQRVDPNHHCGAVCSHPERPPDKCQANDGGSLLH